MRLARTRRDSVYAFDPFDELREQRRLEREAAHQHPEFHARMFMGYGGGAAAFAADAADFDGVNDTASHGTMTGQSSQSSGTVSIWVFVDTLAHQHNVWRAHDTGGFSHILDINTSGFFILTLHGATNRMTNSTTAITTAGWAHMVASWNGTTNQMVVNGVSQTLSTDVAGGPIDWSNVENWYIGRDNANTAGTRFDGGMAELYLNHTTRLDLSVAANVEKFRSSGGKAVNLGSDGSTPTGGQPILYLHLDDGETANNFVANAGSGGGLTIAGALSTRASSPTD